MFFGIDVARISYVFIINFFARLISILSSAAAPSEIAAGFSMGIFLGLCPSLALSILAYLLLIIFNVNITTALFALAFFRIVAYAVAPLLHSLGYFVLAGIPVLHGFWTALYNTPFIPFTGYNNTVVMGGLICSLVIFVPCYFLAMKGVIEYRKHYDGLVRRWKVLRIITTSQWYRNFMQFRRLGDKLWS